MSDHHEESRLERGLKNTGKRAGKAVGRKIAKAASRLAMRAISFIGKKLIFTKVGLPILIGIVLLLIIFVSFESMFGSVAAGELCGEGVAADTQNNELREMYQKAADKANPKIKSDDYGESQYMLTWGILYAIDLLSKESGVPPIEGTKGHFGVGNLTKKYCNDELPHNDLAILANKLKPSFEYKTFTKKTTTVTEVVVEKEILDEDGEVIGTEEVVEEVTEVNKEKVRMVTYAKTYKGEYTYSYVMQTIEEETESSSITIEFPELDDFGFTQDFSPLDNVIMEYLDMDEVTDDDRELVLQLAESADWGVNNVGFLIGEEGDISGILDGFNLATLPPEWLEAFERAGKRYNVDPAILIGIAMVESTFNPKALGPVLPEGDRAMGLMQFRPATFEWIGVDGDGDGKKDILNPIDSIFSAARYLNHLGISKNLEKALNRYSGGGGKKYINNVMRYARQVKSGQTVIGGGNGFLAWPVPTHRAISSHYGTRILGGKRDDHKGIDIAAPIGTPIVAAADGVVLHSGSASGFGNMIAIDHGNGIVTVYGHMYKGGLLVKKGEKVKKGQIIAEVGNSGRSTGPHLHFQVEVKGKPVNPLRYL